MLLIFPVFNTKLQISRECVLISYPGNNNNNGLCCLNPHCFPFFPLAQSPAKLRVTRSADLNTQKAIEILNTKQPEHVISKDKLKRLATRAVQLSRGFNVEKLQRMYSVLSATMYQHRKAYDKTRMVSVSTEISSSRPGFCSIIGLSLKLEFSLSCKNPHPSNSVL